MKRALDGLIYIRLASYKITWIQVFRVQSLSMSLYKFFFQFKGKLIFESATHSRNNYL